MMEKKLSEWIKVTGVMTPGGDPAYKCSHCKSEFVFGIEQAIKEPPDKCPDCGGKGYKRVKKNVKVHIIAGINNGQQIRVKGMGKYEGKTLHPFLQTGTCIVQYCTSIKY